MDRIGFLQSLAGFSFATAVGSPAPSPTPSIAPWDECTVGSLPYDKPLGLKMRVLDGPDFDLMQYRGRPVMLNIFATWCPPCVREMIDYREKDDTVRAFRKKFSIPYPIAMDENGGFSSALELGKNATTFPNTLFIRPDGYLYCFVRGAMEKDEFTYRTQSFLRDCATLQHGA